MTIAAFLDRMIAEQEQRHAWLIEAAERLRRENPPVAASSNRHTPMPGEATGLATEIDR